jgi:hypothetical protein
MSIANFHSLCEGGSAYACPRYRGFCPRCLSAQRRGPEIDFYVDTRDNPDAALPAVEPAPIGKLTWYGREVEELRTDTLLVTLTMQVVAKGLGSYPARVLADELVRRAELARRGLWNAEP